MAEQETLHPIFADVLRNVAKLHAEGREHCKPIMQAWRHGRYVYATDACIVVRSQASTISAANMPASRSDDLSVKAADFRWARRFYRSGIVALPQPGDISTVWLPPNVHMRKDYVALLLAHGVRQAYVPRGDCVNNPVYFRGPRREFEGLLMQTRSCNDG